MYCGFCGKKLDDQAMFCPYCGAFTEYGEKVSRHEVLPPSQAWGRNTPAGADPAINPDGSLNLEAYRAGRGMRAGENAAAGAGGEKDGYYYNPPAFNRLTEEANESGANLALAGLICSFLFWPAGLVLSICAMFRLRKRKNGRAMAIAGLVVSGLNLVLIVLSMVLAFSETGF